MKWEAGWPSQELIRRARRVKRCIVGIAMLLVPGARAVRAGNALRAATPVALLCVGGPAVLSGCMALALAPAVVGVGSMVSGSLENVIKVTIDEKTFTAEVRALLLNAKSLAIVAGDRSSIKAADLFESRGGYQVSIDRPTAKVGEMTGSERREALRKLCASSRADAALMGRTTKTETGNMMLGALTGRAKVKNDWTMEMLACRANTPHSFGGTFEFDGGIYNQKVEAEYEELIGAEIGGKILDALDKGRTQAADSRPPAQAAHTPTQTDSVSAVQAPGADAKSVPMTIAEVQKRLLELGYEAGAPDGVMGRKTANALRKFQRDNNIPVTGRPDSETSSRLGSASRVR